MCGVAAADYSLPPGPKVTAPGQRDCGAIERFGQRFPVEAQGIGCGEARGLAGRHGCRLQLHRQWSCFSLREYRPFVVWFPTHDLFAKAVYPVVVLRRYPCSEANVTPSLFGLAEKGFPTRRQMLADDVIRCRLLRTGAGVAEVEALLGPPDGKEPGKGRFWFIYGLGPERDSIIQIDPELLEIEFRGGRMTSISMVQG